jgi:hypothetical protein
VPQKKREFLLIEPKTHAPYIDTLLADS